MRYWFGDGITDWTMAYGEAEAIPGAVVRDALTVGGVEVTCWNARTGGTRYTDLQGESGVAVDHVVASSGDGGRGIGQIPAFRGPDNVRELWLSAGGGPRALMVGRVDAVDRNGDRMLGPLVLADGSPAASQEYALPRSGGVLAGPLTLSGPPTAPLHAATKAWVEGLGGGGGAVASVNGKTGAVVLTTGDVGAAPATHSHTIGQVTDLAAQLAAKAALAHDHPNRMAAYRYNGATYVAASDAGLYAGPVDPVTLGLSVPDGSVWINTSGG